jgi:lysozyme
MNKNEKYLLIGGGVLLALTLGAVSYVTYLRPFLAAWESFSPVPYWDVKRWSWGYGTAVPGSIPDPSIRPSGSITRSAAFAAMQTHFENDKRYLMPLIRIPLNSRQWAALLSFSYNLGPGNADNLIPNINAGNRQALGDQWNEYIYSGGVVNSDLIERRAAEWSLFNS